MNPLEPLDDNMIPAAMRVGRSLGRRHAEEEHPLRNPYQRDRDRIIHASAFRRLEYKTQVFVNGEGDHYRTRLTHTLEVTQIARSIARALGLNEDLAEAVALSHDLGHTPFGHAGERKLNELLVDGGGFDHNVQGLRVVDYLERRYANFVGLNLTYEVREAFIRHGGVEVAKRQEEFDANQGPLLEVAATLAADDIAYLAHDIDDGLYSGILCPNELRKQDLWRKATAVDGFDDYSPSLKRSEGVRRLINVLVNDLVENSQKEILRYGLTDAVAAKKMSFPIVSFSIEVEKNKSDLKAFLFSNFYRHPNVMAVMEEAQKMLGCIFIMYVNDCKKMPVEYQKIADIVGVKRAAADYVAGMTDRFASEEYVKFFGE